MFKPMTLAAVLTLSITGIANAGYSYTFEANRSGNAFYNQDGQRISAGINDRAGKVHNISGEYNESAKTFSWSVTADKGWDSLWLVVNSGGNPKSSGQQGKIGMIYFDRENGTNLSIYKYQNANSYKTQELIASSRNDDSFIKSMGFSDNNDKRTGEFTLDVSAINKAFGNDGIGLAYGETIGVWMHVFDRRGKNGAVYGKDGGLIEWDYTKHGWVDTNGFGTTKVVPTPSAAAAGLLGLAMVLRRRRNTEEA